MSTATYTYKTPSRYYCGHWRHRETGRIVIGMVAIYDKAEAFRGVDAADGSMYHHATPEFYGEFEALPSGTINIEIDP